MIYVLFPPSPAPKKTRCVGRSVVVVLGSSNALESRDKGSRLIDSIRLAQSPRVNLFLILASRAINQR